MKRQNATVFEDILLALVIGATIVVLLAAVENQSVALGLTRILLWPGHHFTYTYDRGAGVVLAAIIDIIIYGFASFLVLRVLRTMLNKRESK